MSQKRAQDAVGHQATTSGAIQAPKPKQRSRKKHASQEDDDPSKRRCVSTACVACRKRKSKCDGNQPSCAACAQVYNTECIYSPWTDHRRKGVYKQDADGLKTKNSTLQTLIQAILNWPEEDVPGLVSDIRSCESLDDVAEKIAAKEDGRDPDEDEENAGTTDDPSATDGATFESHLFGKMGDLRLDDGSVRYIGGTSTLIHLDSNDVAPDPDEFEQQEDPITSWSNVTKDPELVLHLVNMYFTWHYTFFTTMSKTLFWRDFSLGMPPANNVRKTYYCTPLLVNAILALGCHFTSNPGARDDPEDSATAGDHFFREAKRLIMENDEHERPRMATVQAMALMSVREAGCGREAKGWIYSGMSFRMASDMGLNLDSGNMTFNKHVNGDDAEEDVRRITFWGCYLFDKCWSMYLGRLPQLPTPMITVPKAEVFPDEDATPWCPYTDSGFTQANSQPARTRSVALQITKLCEISNDLLQNFYNPSDLAKAKGKAGELKKLSDIHTRLESWRRDLPKELEPKEGGLSSVLVMHMFFQLLFIHLFRPFLKYTQATSPLPQTVSPRKLCTQAAAMISKLLRLYKRSHGLRQICNIAVYIAHSACTIHLLNLPDKNARRDIVHGVKHLEEIAEGWLGARRTLSILSVLARKWNIELPEEAETVLSRTEAKYGVYMGDVSSPSSEQNHALRQAINAAPIMAQPIWQVPTSAPMPDGFYATSEQTPNGQFLRPHSSGASQHASPPEFDPMRGQQYPQVASTLTPQRMPSGHTPNRPMNARNAGHSPGTMFGGVEQLLRDTSDWAYRDQAQLASEFGNWNALDAVDPSSNWLSGPNGAGSASFPIQQQRNQQIQQQMPQQIPQSMPQQMPQQPQQPQQQPQQHPQPQQQQQQPVPQTMAQPVSMQPAFDMSNVGRNNSVASANANAYSVMTWINGANPYTDVMTYDEEEWYR